MDDEEQTLGELLAAMDADASSERRYEILAILFDEDDGMAVEFETREGEVLH